MEKKKKKYTEQEAYTRLSALCAMGEHCCHDVQKKMKNWELPEGAEERIVEKLVKERFIDEGRFARAFVMDKFRYNRWGKIRIQQELRLRQIPQKHIDEALEEIESDDNLSTLSEIIKKKRPSVKGRNEYEIKGKLIRFALGRGFSMDDITKVIGNIDEADY
ncbi:MAG: RecX family transcriptional regulator [Prevotellaceae bacterium]|nr:RecX family transcriptional regulator [Prevotellaceae bacterium]